MAALPRPDEPTFEMLCEHASGYENGLKEYLGDGPSIDESILVKQGTIGYLWDHWSSHDIDYRDVQSATGDAGWLLEAWHDDDEQWDSVVEKLEDRLDRRIE